MSFENTCFAIIGVRPDHDRLPVVLDGPNDRNKARPARP